MKLTNCTCPGCGAPLKPEEGSKTLKCEYCGQTIVLEDEEDERQHLEDLAFARERARYRVQDEREDKARARRWKIRAIVLAVFFGLAVIGIAYSTLSKPKCDPFDYVSVRFSGTDGEGRAEISAKGTEGIDVNLIDYKLSSDRDLSEGNYVTLTASSTAYRLSSTTKQFEVNGLDLYLKDLDSLSDEILEIIHRKSEEINDRNLQGVTGLSDDNEILSREPACMYLSTDGKNNNILHDITKIVVRNYEGEEKTIYISAYYEDIIVRDGEEKSFNYDRCMYCGNQIWLGKSTLRNGLIEGFDSPESVETHIRTTLEGDMKILKRDF